MWMTWAADVEVCLIFPEDYTCGTRGKVDAPKVASDGVLHVLHCDEVVAMQGMCGLYSWGWKGFLLCSFCRVHMSLGEFGLLVLGERVFVLCLRLSSSAVAMSKNDERLVPKPACMAGPADEGRTLAWTLVIESGHTPLRTRLWTCNRDLCGQLRRRHVYWVPGVMFEDMIRVWALLRGGRKAERFPVSCLSWLGT